MDDFVIEYELEKVVSNTTRNYLKEVISSYENGNYRAAIVVLYSVVLYDLFEKMQILSDVYNDQEAHKVLLDLKVKEENNSPYSEREKHLLVETKKRNLLNSVEADKINHLREMRNWCAHPVYNHEYKLINPTREEVRSYIRISFEAVFQKEALLSRKILDDILQQTNDFYLKVSTVGLEKYLNDRFYSKMNESAKDIIFDSLWTIVLKLRNEQCNKTRISSYYALLYLINDNPKHYYNKVKGEIKYSDSPIIEWDISDAEGKYYPVSPGNSPLEALIYLVCEHPQFYAVLNESIKAVLEGTVKKNSRYLTLAWYISKNMAEHFRMLMEKRNNLCQRPNGFFDILHWDMFDFSDLMFLYRVSEKSDAQDVVKDFMINQYIGSPSYNCSDSMWSDIYGVITIFTDIELNKILDGMNKNSQIYDARSKNNMVNSFANYYERKTGLKINHTNYPNLW